MNWQLDRALYLHRECCALHTALRAGLSLRQAIPHSLARLAGAILADGRPLKVSESTLRRAYQQWLEGGQHPQAISLDYRPSETKLPAALIREIHRLASLATGGRHADGRGCGAQVYQRLAADWKRGASIPGLGDWEQWWDANHADKPHPRCAPPFPFSARTVQRYIAKMDAATRAGGVLGSAALDAGSVSIPLDYSQLRRAELWTLDDVRLDFLAVDTTGKACAPVLYVLMEVGSRRIFGYTLKWVPHNLVERAKAKEDLLGAHIHAEDVDELLACLWLPVDGAGYSAHIFFERGHTACSPAAERVLEGMSAGRIKVHRTGIHSGVRWTGAAADRSVGRSTGKAVIESFNRWLHQSLLDVPGQRGNHRDNKPQNLDNLLKDPSGRLLSTWQAEKAVRMAMERHNAEQGRNLSGHGRRVVEEIQAGRQWIPASEWPDAPAGLPRRTVEITHSPMEEWEVRGGEAAPVSDELAAALAMRKEFRRPGRDGITWDNETYWHPDSLALHSTNYRREKGDILCAVNPQQPEKLHIFTPSGKYVETLPTRTAALGRPRPLESNEAAFEAAGRERTRKRETLRELHRDTERTEQERSADLWGGASRAGATQAGASRRTYKLEPDARHGQDAHATPRKAVSTPAARAMARASAPEPEMATAGATFDPWDVL